MMATQYPKTQVIESFSRYAPSYESHAFVQKTIGLRLIDRCQLIQKKPEILLDLGAGTGMLTPALKNAFPKAQIIELDRAWGMLEVAKKPSNLWEKITQTKRLVQADIESLPFQSNSVDMVFSNCTFQWSNDLKQLFQEILRVLKPGGDLFFSTFGPDTLSELKACWADCDQNPHIHDFLDMHHFGDHLLNVGIQDPVVNQQKLKVTYSTLNQLLMDLKNTGARNHNPDRSRGLTPPRRFKQLEKAFRERLDEQSLFHCTYEVIYGHAHKVTSTPKSVPIALKS